MLSLERIRELLGEPSLTDREAEEVRDGLRQLAEIIFEQWQGERANGDTHQSRKGEQDRSPEEPKA